MFLENIPYNLNSNSKGYTLIEIIVVIVLIGVMALVFIRPNFYSLMDTTNLRGSKLQIKSDTTSLRIDSMRTLKKHKIVFNPGSDIYAMYIEASTGNQWEEKSSGYQLPTGLTITSTTLGDDQLVFDSLGTPYDDDQSVRPNQISDALTSTATITIQTGNGSQATLSIVPETGYVSFD